MHKITSILATRFFEEPVSEGKAELKPLTQQHKSQPWAYKGEESTTENDNNTNTMDRSVYTSALPEEAWDVSSAGDTYHQASRTLRNCTAVAY